MLLPGVFVANVLLEGPGNPAPLRVAVDCAEKAFELDPWATPATQVRGMEDSYLVPGTCNLLLKWCLLPVIVTVLKR
jgi:hypothetical protein